jgi:RUN domain
MLAANITNEKQEKKKYINNNANCKRYLQYRLLKIRYCLSWLGTTNMLHIQLSQARYFSWNAFDLLIINTLGNSKLKNGSAVSYPLNNKQLIKRENLSFWTLTSVTLEQLFVCGFTRTNSGRMRVWLRLAVMQKTLADYFKVLAECSHAFIL